ncbi:MAG: LLM class flavin-dependent oxidoreductase [Polyangiaceae bacterium]
MSLLQKKGKQETMPVEFIGGLFPRNQLAGPGGSSLGSIDREYLRDLARAHEHAGFDSVLTLTHDPLLTASYAAAHTERLKFMIAHRPALIAPTIAARAFASADHYTGGGRLRLHAITGISAEPAHGEFVLDKDERYARTNEYLEVVRRSWTSNEPFDFEGKYFKVKGAFLPLKPLTSPHVEISIGGSSDAAYPVAVRHTSLYALWGEPLADVKEQIGKLHSAAAALELPAPRVSLSVRLILGPTEDLAWQKAKQIQAALERNYKPIPGRVPGTGTKRLLAAAQRGERHDRALWMSTATAVGATHDSTALVGTPDTVVAALLDYFDIGVSAFLVRGYEPLYDAIDYGRYVIPAVREAVRERERAQSERSQALRAG